MNYVVAILHLLFAAGIITHQVVRFRRNGTDLLNFIGLGYALAYGLGPAYFYLVDADEVSFRVGVEISYAPLKMVAESYNWMALGLYAGSYVLACVGYQLTRKAVRSMSGSGATHKYEWSSYVCLAIGGILLTIYISELGGLQTFFSISMYLRSDETAIFRFGVERVAFLKNAAMILLSASILSFINWRQKGTNDLRSLAVFLISLTASIMLMIHRAGRVDLAAFVGSFLVAHYFGTKKVPYVRVVGFVVVFACFAAVGKSLFWMMNERSTETFELGSVARIFHTLMFEVLFPHITTITAMAEVPMNIPYRFFVDIPIAIVNLVPSGLFDVSKLPNVGNINSDLIAAGGAIPVDLVGFGYYSLGIPGVAIWTFLIGMIAGFLDKRLRREPPAVALVTLAFCGVTFGLRVLYCEPTHIILNSLHVAVVLFVVLLPWGSNRTQRIQVRTPSLVTGIRPEVVSRGS